MQRRSKVTGQFTESALQQQFVHWIRNLTPKPLFCATLGQYLVFARQRVHAKAEGYEKGVPDIFFFQAMEPYHGLAIEMKTAIGEVAEHQVAWHDALREEGWRVEVCRSVEEAKNVYLSYTGKETT